MMHHMLLQPISKDGMARNTEQWWKRFTRKRSNGNARPTPETRRLVRKALQKAEEAALPPSTVERPPAELRRRSLKHTRYPEGGHVHFYREHLLFGDSVVRKDPITRKFKRSKLIPRRDGFYTGDGDLYGDGR